MNVVNNDIVEVTMPRVDRGKVYERQDRGQNIEQEARHQDIEAALRRHLCLET